MVRADYFWADHFFMTGKQCVGSLSLRKQREKNSKVQVYLSNNF